MSLLTFCAPCFAEITFYFAPSRHLSFHQLLHSVTITATYHLSLTPSTFFTNPLLSLYIYLPTYIPTILLFLPRHCPLPPLHNNTLRYATPEEARVVRGQGGTQAAATPVHLHHGLRAAGLVRVYHLHGQGQRGVLWVLCWVQTIMSFEA